MKHQYVGDINDYRKYALLRALSAGGAGVGKLAYPLRRDAAAPRIDHLGKPVLYGMLARLPAGSRMLS